MSKKSQEDIEIDLLLEGIKRRYGYDFRRYSRDSLKRRLTEVLAKSRLKFFTELLHKAFHDEVFFDSFLRQMSVTVTELFRDPAFFLSIRENIIPTLKTFPFIKIWHAGCATGEEAYSMAILLHEEGFLDRARIYATDFNKHSLEVANDGVYPLSSIEKFRENYQQAGGQGCLEDYYTTKYDLVKFKSFLKDRITFTYHNLVTDGVFGEMNLISCRNVLIYFDKELQNRVFTLFLESLRHGGFLCLGGSEALVFSAVERQFKAIDSKQKIFKRQDGYLKETAHV